MDAASAVPANKRARIGSTLWEQRVSLLRIIDPRKLTAEAIPETYTPLRTEDGSVYVDKERRRQIADLLALVVAHIHELLAVDQSAGSSAASSLAGNNGAVLRALEAKRRELVDEWYDQGGSYEGVIDGSHALAEPRIDGVYAIDPLQAGEMVRKYLLMLKEVSRISEDHPTVSKALNKALLAKNPFWYYAVAPRTKHTRAAILRLRPHDLGGAGKNKDDKLPSLCLRAVQAVLREEAHRRIISPGQPEETFSEDEVEMYHGFHGSWPVEENRGPSRDEKAYFGVKLGSIMKHATRLAAKEAARLSVPAPSKLSHPLARFYAPPVRVHVAASSSFSSMSSDAISVGTKIKKQFAGEWFSGELVSTDIEKGSGGKAKTLFRVRYSDGDEEDLYQEEIAPLVVPAVTSLSPPSSAATTTTTTTSSAASSSMSSAAPSATPAATSSDVNVNAPRHLREAIARRSMIYRMRESETVYNPHCWDADGRVVFVHTGGGWKNREFFGSLMLWPSAPGRGEESAGEQSVSVDHAFWSTPRAPIFAHGPSGLAWVAADTRIKGFDSAAVADYGDDDDDSDDGDDDASAGKKCKKRPLLKFCLSRTRLKHGVKATSSKGHASMLQLFSIGSKLCCLSPGVVQTWDLSQVAPHDGVRRYVSMSSVEHDLAKWPADEVYDSSDNTWMDDCGGAEVSVGVSHTSASACQLLVPEHMGYLGRTPSSPEQDGRSGFVFGYGRQDGEGVGRLVLLDSELRTRGLLVGHNGLFEGVCRRPTFAHDPNMLASFGGPTGAKLWDVRTMKPVTTVPGDCKYAVPISSGGLPFLATSCGRGVGTRIWDIRMQRPLYALPTAPDKFVWMPESQCLVNECGTIWRFGFAEGEWHRKSENLKHLEEETWGKLKTKKNAASDGGDGGGCCVM